MYQLTDKETKDWEIAKILFPYPQMKVPQEKIIRSIISSSNPLLVSSHTGVGKTAAVMTAYLAIKKPTERIVVFVRTKAQINVFLRELSSIHKQIVRHWNILEDHFSNFPVFLPFLGKNELCLKAKKEYPGEMYTHICNLTRCPLKAKTQRVKREDLLNSVRELYHSFSHVISREDLYSNLNTKNYCPYFYSYYLMQKADVIITSYPFLENQALFARLFYSIDTTIPKILALVDEAHNLYKPINQEISRTSIENALEELPNKAFSNLLELFESKQVMESSFNELEIKRLEEDLFSLLQSQIVYKKSMAFNAYLAYHFLKSAQNRKLISDGKKLSIVNTRSSEILENISNAKRLTLMSGSFEPVRSYQRIFQLPKSRRLRVLPPKEEIQSRYFVVVNQKLNAKFDNRTPDYYILVSSTIRNLFDEIPGHTLVFVPSYSYIEKLLETDVLSPDIVESPGQDITTLQAIIVSSEEKKLIICVTGGKIAEGIEFTAAGKSLIKGIIITALPFPPPSEENRIIYEDLANQFDPKLARDFSLIIPMLQRLSQSFGRAIRNKGDKAVHILLDPRGTKYTREFNFERHTSIKNLKEKIRMFFTRV
ncbi:MAG: hypothetical protein KGD64_05415 [Candidatus Heimdallarchaeota archaeon]|nr:hypothetical protein [Candidatus Heimdallarchaeota archaeon]